jgi:hypothetical protein
MYEFAITHDFYPIFSSFSPILREKSLNGLWGVQNLDPLPQIAQISLTPEGPQWKMLHMKGVWISVKNVWIFAETQIAKLCHEYSTGYPVLHVCHDTEHL